MDENKDCLKKEIINGKEYIVSYSKEGNAHIWGDPQEDLAKAIAKEINASNSNTSSEPCVGASILDDKSFAITFVTLWVLSTIVITIKMITVSDSIFIGLLAGLGISFTVGLGFCTIIGCMVSLIVTVCKGVKK